MNVSIDGQTVEAENGKLLQHMLDTGLDLPHFCYHPALSIPANCRQCLVEVGTPAMDRETRQPQMNADGSPVIAWMPKLQTSCSVDMTDGMHVRTHVTSALVRDAQEGNLEFLLINHPLDCPICDQAGQCPLQIQAYKYGPEGSRFEFRKVHKPKRVPLGPRVTLDAERCINCTRCTRFTSEVSGSNQLTIISRGVKNYPMTPPGTVFDDPYSLNTVDICPVGALTSSETRFQARAWEMSQTPSITVRNAKGANCYYGVRDNLVLSVTARPNADVNGFWLADDDRAGLDAFNDGRASGARVRVGGMLQAADWTLATTAAADVLRSASRAVFVGSANASVEDNYLLQKLAASVGGTVAGYLPHVVAGAGDGWLVTDDKTPNARGVEALGMTALSGDAFRGAISGADALVVLGDDPLAMGACTLGDLDGVAVIAMPTHEANGLIATAAVVLPLAMVVETVGTYVSEDGHAQRSVPCKAIRAVNRTLVMAMGASRTDQHGTPFDRWYNESHKVDCLPGWAVLPDIASALGHEMRFKGPKQILDTLAAEHDAFAGLSYDAMGTMGVRLAGAAVDAA